MRARHSSHALPAFPVFSSSFLSSNTLALGGGGGASKTGIKNKLRLYNVGDDRSLQLLDELELENGEDAPMSMATDAKTNSIICGVNSTMEKIQKGQNENCRVFSVKEQKLELLNTKGTIPPDDTEDYQKVTVSSPDGSMLVVAGSHDFSLLSFPSLALIAGSVHVEKEIYGATFSTTTLVVATTANLLVYALPTKGRSTQSPKGKGKGKAKKGKSTNQPTAINLELLQTIDLPATLGTAVGGTFRAVRYHPLDSKILYTVVNTSPPRSRKSKTSPRQAFVCKWNTDTWTVEKIRKVGDRQITCFDVSDNGRLLGYGLSDLSIGLLDTNSFSPLVAILKAHEFPLTTISFNPTSTLLVSGSADHSIRIVSVPQTASGSPWGVTLVIIMTLIIILLAFAVQRYLTSGRIAW